MINNKTIIESMKHTEQNIYEDFVENIYSSELKFTIPQSICLKNKYKGKFSRNSNRWRFCIITMVLNELRDWFNAAKS